MVQAPIFHVNATITRPPSAVVADRFDFSGRSSRRKWLIDMFVSPAPCPPPRAAYEGDTPRMVRAQGPLPSMQATKAHPSVAKLYSESMVREGILTAEGPKQFCALRGGGRLSAAFDAAQQNSERIRIAGVEPGPRHRESPPFGPRNSVLDRELMSAWSMGSPSSQRISTY